MLVTATKRARAVVHPRARETMAKLHARARAYLEVHPRARETMELHRARAHRGGRFTHVRGRRWESQIHIRLSDDRFTHVRGR